MSQRRRAKSGETGGLLGEFSKGSGRCLAGKEWTADGDPVPGFGRSAIGIGRGVRARAAVQRRERPSNLGHHRRAVEECHAKNLPVGELAFGPRPILGTGRSGEWKDLESLADNPKSSGSITSSTQSGLRDRVSEAEAQKSDGSLFLLHVEDLKLRYLLRAPPSTIRSGGYRRISSIAVCRYQLWVTDPVIERQYWQSPTASTRSTSVI